MAITLASPSKREEGAVLRGDRDGERLLQVGVGWDELSEEKQDSPQYRVCIKRGVPGRAGAAPGEELLPELTRRLELPRAR